jgi:transglutaminase-like putative cysteine protease
MADAGSHERIVLVPLIRPLSRRVTRGLSILTLVAWIVSMGVLVNRAYLQASSNLAVDLARYGAAAEWRGVYYRGEKVGFTVSQTVPTDQGFELQEDGRLQMSLLGATTAATLQTKAQVDRNFALRSFEFSLDPGTGPVAVNGRVDGRRLSLVIKTSSGTQTEERELNDVPVLSLNLPRRLASQGLKAGSRQEWMVFDPATLRNQPVVIEIGKREMVNEYAGAPIRVGGREVLRTASRSIPAFRVDMRFAGLRTSSWVTDTGEVVREESPTGFLSVRESPEAARRMAIGGRIQGDLLEAAAVIPVWSTPRPRLDDPRDVRRLKLQLAGIDLANADLQGAGQSVQADVVEIVDARSLRATAADADLRHYLEPEPLIESNDPAIRAEARAALEGVTGTRAQAERLTRRVNAMLDKKPTVSLPSAREVLRTKVGDCNEHTALYVAMARASGIPARIAVGLVYTRGAFYYHAWPEVFVDHTGARGVWLPVDPTFNQFPADATHVRLARGGLDRQAAIIPLIGNLKMTILDVDLAPNARSVLVGRQPTDMAPLAVPIPRRSASGCCSCWSSPSRLR